MGLRKPVPSDPSIKVQVFKPASVYQRLREHADRTGSSIGRLCREGALRELECAAAPAPAALP
jgi:hypothetical protein